jgi:fructose-bisphosphate aldolase class 1
MSKYISGVILYDETIWQNAKDGTPLVKLIEQAGASPASRSMRARSRCRTAPAN